MHALQFGLQTFGDVTVESDGRPSPHGKVIRHVVEEAVVAEQAGVDFFGVGEHHRSDFAISAPEIVLAVIAGRTSRIRLGSAVTVLSSDDPVRVFQRFSTLHAAADGRAEVILGRGSYTESFPLFGFDLSQYDVLFEEKLDLFTKLLTQRTVSWSGKTRTPLQNQAVTPTLAPGTLRTWIAVGASPPSLLRAANHNLPLILAAVGGEAKRFEPLVALYKLALEKLGLPVQPIGVHSLGYVAETDQQAAEDYWPDYKVLRDQLGVDRGWPSITRAQFEREIMAGSLYVGSPETVARRIVETIRTLGLARFDMRYSAGGLSHGKLCRSIELYGRRVIPLARDMLADAGGA